MSEELKPCLSAILVLSLSACGEIPKPMSASQIADAVIACRAAGMGLIVSTVGKWDAIYEVACDPKSKVEKK
jgi:hypothetical protein